MDPNFQRYKHDALRYYNEDIAWFSYCFVLFMLHSFMLYKYTIHKPETDYMMKVIYACYMIVFSLIRLIMLMPYRSADQQYTSFSKTRWIVLFVLEFIGAALFFAFKEVKGSNTFACCLIDSICLIYMFFIYKQNEIACSKSADKRVPLLRCLRL